MVPIVRHPASGTDDPRGWMPHRGQLYPKTERATDRAQIHCRIVLCSFGLERHVQYSIALPYRQPSITVQVPGTGNHRLHRVARKALG
jgi:hypothetical protein